MRTGDLLGSGTISSDSDSGLGGGSLLELSENGKKPVGGLGTRSKTFLEDGDTVTMRGFAFKEGYGRVGFGQCAGRIGSALQSHFIHGHGI